MNCEDWKKRSSVETLKGVRIGRLTRDKAAFTLSGHDKLVHGHCPNELSYRPRQ
jgi:hypothetical protein